ncbi:MAG: HipA domain-containing protein [Bacilli bacterium]|nr:HipA domain-containing protein [Bacilli bacterium]
MEKAVIERINELNKEITKLPKGYISIKKIGGNIYYYHQWNEDGKKVSKYLNQEELLKLNALIKQRQELEQELKALKFGYNISFTLMHLNQKVVDLIFDDKGNLSFSKLSEWWNERSIPLSRSGIQDVFDKLNIANSQPLLLKCFGLSLSDQYWIKPKSQDMSWEVVNFFNNEFSEDVGELLLGGRLKKKDLDLSSPDNTSIGNLKKRWKIIDGKRILIKGGSNPFRQEPYNEVVASKVADVLGIPHISYSLKEIEGYPYSICEDFIKEDEDLVPAYLINKTLKKNNNDSNYTHLLKCSKTLCIKEFKAFLDRLIVFDFIIANEDRHFNNFGVIRNSKTLEFIGFAPIYDSGSSFGYNKISEDIKPFKDIESKPFKSNIIDQLKLVSSFDWLDIKKLEYIKTNIKIWFTALESKYLTKERIKAISEAVVIRIDYLIAHINK